MACESRTRSHPDVEMRLDGSDVHPATPHQEQPRGGRNSSASPPAPVGATATADTAHTTSAPGAKGSNAASPEGEDTVLPGPDVPAQPRGGIAPILQRMPSAERWALGLGLAFCSGLAFLLSLGPFPFGAGPFAFAATGTLALSAGFVLSRWRAALALAVAADVGGWVGSWLLAYMSPGGAASDSMRIRIVFAAFAWFVVFGLVPLLIFLLAGVGMGKWRGVALGEPRIRVSGDISVSRWIAAFGPVVVGGFLAPGIGSTQADVASALRSVLYAAVLAASCLVSGWLLRSWWGGMVGPVVYVGIAALTPYLQEGASSLTSLTGEFVVSVVLPAVVMSAIGTAIGMFMEDRRSRMAGA